MLGFIFFRLDEDLLVNGYQMKKGTDLTINMSSILNDPETFPNPTKFDPERFLGELGHVRTQRMIPFGIGELPFEPVFKLLRTIDSPFRRILGENTRVRSCFHCSMATNS